MRVLLINPPAEHTLCEAPQEGGKDFISPSEVGKFPPLGLLYIIAYLEKHLPGHEIHLRDCLSEQISHEDLLKDVERLQPDVIGISSFTFSMVDVVLAARNARRVCPKAHLVLGGHHAIAFPLEAAGLPEFDSIIVGEGEVPFTELVKRLDAGQDYTDILGVYTKESILRYQGDAKNDSRFLSSVMVPASYNDNLDELPFPARKYIQHIKYFSMVGVSPNLATIISSRGCPYRCTYCDVPYKRYRERSAESVVDEVEECLAMGYDEFHFYDDLFNVTPQKLMRFCDEIEKRKLSFVWDFRGRVNTATYESLKRAKECGLRMISFGVETGTDEGLKAIRKKTTTAKVVQVLRWCRQLDIRTIADFIIGFPFEKTKGDILKSLKFVHKADPDYAMFAVLILLPHTQIFEDATRKGITNIERWKKFAANPMEAKDFYIDNWTEHFTREELAKLQKRAYRQFYLRPKPILRQLMQVKSWHEFIIKVKGALAILN